MFELDNYLEDLFIEVWFDPDEFDELLEEWRPILLSRITAKIALKLPTLERAQAEMYLGEWETEKFWKLCEDNIPNYEDYFVEILDEFEKEYLDNFKNV